MNSFSKALIRQLNQASTFHSLDDGVSEIRCNFHWSHESTAFLSVEELFFISASWLSMTQGGGGGFIIHNCKDFVTGFCYENHRKPSQTQNLEKQQQECILKIGSVCSKMVNSHAIYSDEVTDGYMVTETDLRMDVFKVTAACAPGWTGCRRGSAASNPLGRHNGRSRSPWWQITNSFWKNSWWLMKCFIKLPQQNNGGGCGRVFPASETNRFAVGTSILCSSRHCEGQHLHWSHSWGAVVTSNSCIMLHRFGQGSILTNQ